MSEVPLYRFLLPMAISAGALSPVLFFSSSS